MNERTVIRPLLGVALCWALGCRAELQVRPAADSDPLGDTMLDSVPRSAAAIHERGQVLDAADPCTEVGVVVPRQTMELHAPRTGQLRAEGTGPRSTGELLYEIVAGDDDATLAAQQAEVEEALATRQRYAAERDSRARELRSAEQLGEYLPHAERNTARDAHTISTREVHRADAAGKAASARLGAQRARIRAGRVQAPFPGRIVLEVAIVNAWVEAGQLLARFASTDDLVLRVALPAEHAPPSSIDVRWFPPHEDGEPLTATLHSTRDEVDELSGLRLYEARVDAQSLANNALGSTVRVEFTTCHGTLPDQGPHHADH